MVRILAIFSLILVLTACGHHRYFKGFEDIPPESSSVYIVRPNHFVGLAASMDVKVDNQHLGYLKSGHFLNTFVEPGSHTILVKAGDALVSNERKVEFAIQPNERAYFLASFGFEGYFGIKQVDAETALKELQEFTEE